MPSGGSCSPCHVVASGEVRKKQECSQVRDVETASHPALGLHKQHGFMYFDEMIVCTLSGGLASTPYPQDRHPAGTGTEFMFQNYTTSIS